MTRLTRQEMHCPGDDESDRPCGSCVVIELRGEYFLRSTSTELEELATRAGWKGGFCPDHNYLAKVKS